MGNALGAYGFRITGLDQSAASLAAVPHAWPQLQVEFRHGVADQPKPPGTVRTAEDHAEVWLGAGDRIELRRDPLTVRFVTREPVPGDAVPHPFLALPAAIANRWLGRYSLHAGAFVHRDRAWALLGAREAGKSATLGYLMQQGHRILTDDVLIIDGTTVFAGPRSVDLRAEAAELGGEPLGFVGNRPRWRLRPQEGEPAVSLAGLVHLEWGDAARLEPLDSEARLRGLIGGSVFAPGPEAAAELLELAALPAWRFVRPPGLGRLGALSAQLLAGLDA